VEQGWGTYYTHQSLSLFFQAPLLEKIMVTGDPKQLDVYLVDVPKYLHPYCFGSILTHTLQIPSISHVNLTLSFRSHPTITTILSESIYGTNLIPGVSTTNRDCTFPFPDKNVPLLLLNTYEKDTRSPHSFSRYNTAQTDLAILIIEYIINNCNSLSAVCICLYSDQVKIIREKFPGFPVFTVDSFQSRESDLIILITTRSMPKSPTEMTSALEFVNNPNRTTVALSRAKRGMIMLGNFSLLKVCPSWNKFLTIAEKHTQIYSNLPPCFYSHRSVPQAHVAQARPLPRFPHAPQQPPSYHAGPSTSAQPQQPPSYYAGPSTSAQTQQQHIPVHISERAYRRPAPYRIPRLCDINVHDFNHPSTSSTQYNRTFYRSNH